MNILFYIIGFFVIGIIFMTIDEHPWLILLLIGIAFIIYFANKKYKNSDYYKKKQKEKEEKLANETKLLFEKMASYGVYPTYYVNNDITAVYIDENNRKLYVPILVDNKVIDVDTITKYEILTNSSNNMQYTAGTYFTGKLKENQNIENVTVRIYLNSISTPFVEIPCMWINHGYKQTTPYDATALAEKIIGALDYLKNNKKKEKVPLIYEIDQQLENKPRKKKKKKTNK